MSDGSRFRTLSRSSQGRHPWPLPPLRRGSTGLDGVPLPLKSLGVDAAFTPADLMGNGKTFGDGKAVTQFRSIAPRVECSFVDLGGLTILSGRTTPIHACEEGVGLSTLTMCYSGLPSYQDGDGRIQVEPGDVLVVPRNGGRISTGYLSSINFPIKHHRLSRTMRAMQCKENGSDLGRALLLAGSGRKQLVAAAGGLFGFFGFVDALLREDRRISVALGLDEQVYRLLALALMRSSGVLETVQERWIRTTNHWANPLDDLVDYIRANAHRGLTLTDLEEQSHDSARHLQNLFKEKFDCTPMQFVRRQRLGAAMEKLQAPQNGDNVTKIARECGYRFTSNFTTDFQRQFGVNPSSVLRASRGNTIDQDGTLS